VREAVTLMTTEPGEGEWVTGEQWRVCAQCRHIHACSMLAAPGDQPGFPEGEWMCRFCICGDYDDDPGWPRPDVFPDPRPTGVCYDDLVREAKRYRHSDPDSRYW
jgi:hypothetical protein